MYDGYISNFDNNSISSASFKHHNKCGGVTFIDIVSIGRYVDRSLLLGLDNK